MADKKRLTPEFLRAMTQDDITAFMQRAGHPAFRAKQLFQWVYEKGARDYEAMTNLSKDLRQWLSEKVPLGGLALERVSGERDETQKLLFRTNDDQLIESVIMRDDFADDDDEEDASQGSTAPMDKVSLCVSSQVGCPLGCQFCMTGEGGFRRQLRTDEILDQVLQARDAIADNERIGNIVFMGMGEPMLNLKAVIPALRLLTDPRAFNIATRRITVSTAGVIPGIIEFGEARTEVNLAVSLNATTQKTRDLIMPGCRKWPIDQLLATCREFPLFKRRRITFEYVLFKDINDTADDLRRLKAMLKGISCKINLIIYNPGAATALEPSSEDHAQAFRDRLADANYTVSLRRSKGRRHRAACGQLAAHVRGLDAMLNNNNL
ncbi:MAG: 23S rRNA (adenine(2503)-C(2))-methyltransferase RlmN [Candidatus Sumerlaeia bacterium]